MGSHNYPPTNHLDSMGRTAGKRIADYGYYGPAEEVRGAGYTTAQQAFDAFIQAGWGDYWKYDQLKYAGIAVTYNASSSYKWYWSVILGEEPTAATVNFCWMSIVTYDLFYPSQLSGSASCDAPPNSYDFTCTITALPKTYTCTSANGGSGYYCSLDINGKANCLQGSPGGAYVCEKKSITTECNSSDSVLTYPDYVCSDFVAPSAWRCNSYGAYTAWAPTYKCELVDSTFQCYYSE